ncbi:MAG: ATP-binding cassette domain-containing protein [Coriobacteriia bacterium]|nr:ATP-binding cassette domain-containing protein [Coriobacteriia bacterium]MCL2749746.1 ATP-binding cassette domain-containing protein [Coriobacteriia bacterium]
MSIEVDIKKEFADFSLHVSFTADDETLGFLGASGCGKSLTLRSIAGLVTPDEGRIVVNGEVFFDSAQKIDLKPQQRKTALLFQDYKLFPNLTVAGNIAAGMPSHLSKEEIHQRVKHQLERFKLKGYGSRYPVRLSGGQQQRVALARMLAAEPGILMLDEPFSALDAHLKSDLEEDLIELFERFEGTVLYVSHDVDEAFRFCDRIAVFDEGRIAQVSTASELVSAPESLASLKVSGVKNISAAKKIDEHHVEAVDWGITLTTKEAVPNDAKWLAIRGNYIRLALPNETENCFEFTVRLTTDSRFKRTAALDPSGIRWNADKLSLTPEQLPEKGKKLRLHFPPQHIYVVEN